MENTSSSFSPDRQVDFAGDDFAIRTLLKEAIRRSPKSREQIADELSTVLGREVSETMLNWYTAKSHTAARLPAAFVGAVCAVTGDDQLQRYLAGPRLRRLIDFAERAVSVADGWRELQELRDEIADDLASNLAPPLPLVESNVLDIAAGASQTRRKEPGDAK